MRKGGGRAGGVRGPHGPAAAAAAGPARWHTQRRRPLASSLPTHRSARTIADTAESASTSSARGATPCREKRWWRLPSGPSATAWARSCCRRVAAQHGGGGGAPGVASAGWALSRLRQLGLSLDHSPPHTPTLLAVCRPQSGELNTPQRMQYLEDVVRAVKERTIALDLEARSAPPPEGTAGLGLCVALSGARAAAGSGPLGGLGGLGSAAARAGAFRLSHTTDHLRTPLAIPPMRSGRAAAGALCAAAGRGRRPLPATHRGQQPGAVRQHPPSGAALGGPRALPARPERPGLHGGCSRGNVVGGLEQCTALAGQSAELQPWHRLFLSSAHGRTQHPLPAAPACRPRWAPA